MNALPFLSFPPLSLSFLSIPLQTRMETRKYSKGKESSLELTVPRDANANNRPAVSRNVYRRGSYQERRGWRAGVGKVSRQRFNGEDRVNSWFRLVDWSHGTAEHLGTGPKHRPDDQLA